MVPVRHVTCRMDRAVITESWSVARCPDMGPPVRDRAIGANGPILCDSRAKALPASAAKPGDASGTSRERSAKGRFVPVYDKATSRSCGIFQASDHGPL